MAEPHTPNSTYTTTTVNPPYGSTTNTTHVHQPQRSGSLAPYLLGAAVVVIGIGALVLGGEDTAPGQPVGDTNNVTIEAPAATPATPAEVTPAPDAPATAQPPAAAPDAAAPTASEPTPADPVAPAPAPEAGPAVPDASTTAPAPAGN